MKYYELTYLIKPELSENEIKGIQEKIISSIQEKEGILDYQSGYEKITLAYSIKKNLEAYISTINFFLKSNNINDIEKKVKAEKEIIRFILFSKRKPEAEKVVEKPKPIKKKDKTELKDIEKKLEEILE